MLKNSYSTFYGMVSYLKTMKKNKEFFRKHFLKNIFDFTNPFAPLHQGFTTTPPSTVEKFIECLLATLMNLYQSNSILILHKKRYGI